MQSSQPTHHGYAVDVKDRELYRDLDRGPLTDDDVQAVYDTVARDFWEQAADIARQHGFRDVYSEGRMGGWAVPQPQPSTDSVGPRIEYVPESELEAWERDRFRPFERDILALLEECRDVFRGELAETVDCAKREPAERAEWEARDTITVER